MNMFLSRFAVTDAINLWLKKRGSESVLVEGRPVRSDMVTVKVINPLGGDIQATVEVSEFPILNPKRKST